MTELNNNQPASKNSMETKSHQNPVSRRRRLCSVVAPQLKVEYTHEGKRTVVVGENRDCPRVEMPKVAITHPADDRAQSFCGQNRQVKSVSDSFLSPKAQTTVSMTKGLQRYCSLPRRVELRRLDNTGSPRAVLTPRVNRCEGQFKLSGTEFLSSGFLPVSGLQKAVDMPRNAEDPRVGPCDRPELAINLPAFSKNMSVKAQCLSTRKTQRSMSAHSVALPGPDSSVLRDPVSGKMYKRGKLLGKGGFARVYEGLELSTNKKYALKIIDKSRLARPPQREKVDAEIELHSAASEIGHPNVVSFETNFENARVICLVLELCDKKSLAQYLRRKEFLSESEVSDITWQIVSGLAHIHGCGLLHRDLKLGNILLGDDMTVKIGDFGLATRASWGKRKTICGTPNFIAPEVLQRQGHGPEADIWAVGCILYTLLVGKPPFETTSLKDTYKCILKNSYRIPATVSQEAADLVRWMLRSKPHARPTLQDVTKHVFFVKHQTQQRFPSLEELEKNFPSKEISPETILPLRRKSVLPRLTVQDQLSSGTDTISSGQVRHNSCPSDPCSIYPTTPAAARNVPTSSAGPKISIIDHMRQASSSQSSSSSSISKTCVEQEEQTNVAPSDCCGERVNVETARHDEQAETATATACNNNEKENQMAEEPHKCNNPTTEPSVCEINNKNSVKTQAVKANTPTRNQGSVGMKVKTSPVKFLASKLQKFKLPSPKSCMRAAANTMKSKSNDNKTTNETPIIPTTATSVVSQATWITKWVDYSNKYGFGYQLADGSICVLFNDGAHIALLPDGKTVEYTEQESSANCIFPLQSPPNALLRPVKILQHFTAYMDKNLRRGSAAALDYDAQDVSPGKPGCAVRMLTWSRTSKHVAMYLSNGTLQVNFCADHTKVNVTNIHKRSAMTVTYVNENKETSVYGGHQLLSAKDSGLRSRLRQVHKEFHLLLASDDCMSHPFCCMLKDNVISSTEPAFECHDAMIAVA